MPAVVNLHNAPNHLIICNQPQSQLYIIGVIDSEKQNLNWWEFDEHEKSQKLLCHLQLSGGSSDITGENAGFASKYGKGAWVYMDAPKVGLYLRLSRDDGDCEVESQSITNQRDFLQRYVEQRGWTVVDIYIDAPDILGLKQNPTKRASL